MSPRAAARLESLGCKRVYDYVAGKADWGSFGLSLEGADPTQTRVSPYIRTDIPNCGPEDRLAAVCERLDESGWDTCFVLDERVVVLGRIGRRAIRGRTDISAAEAMTLGPSTIRPSARLAEVVERMQRQKLNGLPVTRSDGVLLGLLLRAEAERALERLSRD